MKKNNLEIRQITTELRYMGEESRTIRGLAIPVESSSELLHDNLSGRDFYEIIDRSAVDDALINANDIKLYMNHDAAQGTYGRSKFGEGTLKLFITERGLEFEADMPNTVFGEALLEGIRRGDVDAVSFAFAPSQQVWTRNGDGTYTRTVKEIGFLDEISVLSVLPAYDATNVDCRSLEQHVKEEQEAIIKDLDNKLEEIYKQVEGYLPEDK